MQKPMILAIAAALALTAGAGNASAASKPCARAHSKTVASNSHVRVFTVAGSEGDKLYGCLRSNGRRQALTADYDDGYVLSGKFSRVRLAGRFVAWQFAVTDISCKADCPPGYEPTTYALRVRDLRKPRTVGVSGRVAGRALVLTTGGAIAWAERTASSVALKAFDAAGARTLDDSDVDVASVRRHGQSVEWTSAGEAHAEKLAPR
jgi:hypothetical protein